MSDDDKILHALRLILKEERAEEKVLAAKILDEHVASEHRIIGKFEEHEVKDSERHEELKTDIRGLASRVTVLEKKPSVRPRSVEDYEPATQVGMHKVPVGEVADMIALREDAGAWRAARGGGYKVLLALATLIVLGFAGTLWVSLTRGGGH